MSLHLLLDSADPNDWKEFLPLGIFEGVTTNPSLLLKANQSCKLENIARITEKAQKLGCKEIHLQAWGENVNEIYSCGQRLNQLNQLDIKVFIKIPITFKGCLAAKKLIEENVSITLTACFDSNQALIADALKVSYIAPYLNRMNSLGKSGIDEIVKMKNTLKALKSESKILTASLKDINEINILIEAGINIFTINPKIARNFFKISETIEAEKIFNKDAKGY